MISYRPPKKRRLSAPILSRNLFRYYVVGFRCTVCARRLKMIHGVYHESDVARPRFLFSLSAASTSLPLCHICVFDQLVLRKDQRWATGKCDWCGQISHPLITSAPGANRFVFGKESWNSGAICPECLLKALTSPTLVQERGLFFSKSTNGVNSIYMTNEAGALLKGPIYVNQNF